MKLLELYRFLPLNFSFCRRWLLIYCFHSYYVIGIQSIDKYLDWPFVGEVFFFFLQNNFHAIMVLKVFIRLKHDENSPLPELFLSRIRNINKHEILTTMNFHFKTWSSFSVEIYRSALIIGYNGKYSHGTMSFVVHCDFSLTIN